MFIKGNNKHYLVPVRTAPNALINPRQEGLSPTNIVRGVIIARRPQQLWQKSWLNEGVGRQLILRRSIGRRMTSLIEGRIPMEMIAQSSMQPELKIGQASRVGVGKRKCPRGSWN